MQDQQKDKRPFFRRYAMGILGFAGTCLLGGGILGWAYLTAEPMEYVAVSVLSFTEPADREWNPLWLQKRFELVRSPALLQRLNSRLRLQDIWNVSPEDAVVKLGKMAHFTPENSGKPEVTIEIHSQSASEAKSIADAISGEITELMRDADEVRLKELRRNIQAKIRTQLEESEAARREMNELAKKYGIIDEEPDRPVEGK